MLHIQTQTLNQRSSPYGNHLFLDPDQSLPHIQTSLDIWIRPASIFRAFSLFPPELSRTPPKVSRTHPDPDSPSGLSRAPLEVLWTSLDFLRMSSAIKGTYLGKGCSAQAEAKPFGTSPTLCARS
ncbi:uncharacterized protein F5147DRAFT_769181 [Suillus discolor]|uniref:Uncharacterized protein n=1 Tax=Suillus discolor TaxID=1912936 RepID=A0A9P7JY77_9AGAM|nr:uncharacterized protein F5147DRAFT_769181 [Suillus discolor]KAG2115752.1 hypothetical protein F5147DRAFT_769181 [Suillus discolor]